MNILLTLAVVAGIVIGGAANGAMLIATGRPFWIMWGVAFCVVTPILGIAEAVMGFRAESRGQVARSSGFVLLTGLVMVQGAMLPLVQYLYDHQVLGQ